MSAAEHNTVTVADIKKAVKNALDEIGVNEQSFLSERPTQNLETLIESKIDDAVRMIYVSADDALLDVESVDDARVETHNTIEQIEPNEEDGDGAERYRVSLASNALKVYLEEKFLRLVSARITGVSWSKVTDDIVMRRDGNDCYTNGTATDDSEDVPEHTWQFPVTDAIPFSSKEYPMLKNKYTTGSEERPKVGMILTPSVEISGDEELSVRTLELYSVDNVGPREYVKDDTHTDDYAYQIHADCQVINMRNRTIPQSGTTASDADTYTIGTHLVRPVIYCIAGLVLQTYKDEHADSMLNIAFTLAGIRTGQTQTQTN